MDKHCPLIHKNIKNDYINHWITNKLKMPLKKRINFFHFIKNINVKLCKRDIKK